MTVYERKQLVKQNGACFKCLLRGHLVAKCRRKVGCLIENCKGTHHTLLHQENPKNPAISTHNVERKSSETSGGEQLARNEETPTKETLSVTSNANRSCLKRKIVALPVKKIDILNGYGQRVTINCLDDSGSQVTLITHRLVESLGLTTRRSNRLTLSGVGDQNIKLNSEVSFLIQAKDNELSIPMTAYAIPKISNYSPPFDIEEIKQKFPYLQDVDVIVDTESVDLLVGQDYPILLRQLETRYGKPDEPYAVRTVLGWSICGPVDERVGEDPSTHLISSCSPTTTSVDDFNLKRFWEIEQMPVKEPSLYTNKEQKILEETERTICRVNGRYQVKLPWKDSTKQIPDSYDVALQRLESIERRMRKQPSLKEKYGKVIEDYVADGYLENYVIKRIVKDYGTNKAKACEALDKDLYMGDLIHSCKTSLDAKKTVTDVCEMLDEGGMKMRNWISNQPCVLEGVPDRIKNGPLPLDQTNERVLGMTWDPSTDQIRFYPVIEDIVWTKRGVLRRLAQLFDPMGLLAAFVVRGNILMQELWRRGRAWDDPLELDIMGSWLI
ncbi:Hypothetical predicted protein [Paramuricea clavata]|uniref:Uncharacterized protein n=1 Tax=Paramuricea clavata TaxID=317549 RepID=A0A6S7IJW3_PARCT|nr:Hypothetical predicted protein [Paramuricea clavata]